MLRDTQALASNSYDLLVVGAGVYGLFAAWDGAMRGLRVALIDRGDFGNATSSNSTDDESIEETDSKASCIVP